MSELEPDPLEVHAPVGMRVHTSRLAIMAAIATVICLPGVSGILGLVLGLLALRQLNATSTLEGRNLAMLGIVGGLMNLLVWGAVGKHVLDVRTGMEAPTRHFLEAWMKSEQDGEDAAAPGLRPLMRHGEGPLLRVALTERFGGFRTLGERSDFSYKVDMTGEHIGGTYPLVMTNGAPCTGTFDYARQNGELAVAGFKLTSPLLVDIIHDGHNELHGSATPDLRDFSDPGVHLLGGGRKVKSFEP